MLYQYTIYSDYITKIAVKSSKIGIKLDNLFPLKLVLSSAEGYTKKHEKIPYTFYSVW
jgi:hypothetical protein